MNFVNNNKLQHEAEEKEDEDDYYFNNTINDMNKIQQTNMTSSGKHHDKMKSLYEELAEKEEALVLAAQFGKTLIEEKEELEKQIETMKREQQAQVESFEQESFQLKRLIETIRNEYENKLGDLNEDVQMLKKELLLKEQSFHSIYHLQQQNEQNELIQQLNEANEKLTHDYKSLEIQLSISTETSQILEQKLSEKENLLVENTKILSNYQKEISKLLNKQQEIEFALLQSINEREKQSKIIEEIRSKSILIENEKSDYENIIFQNENEIYNLRKLNQNLMYKLECLTNINHNNKRTFASLSETKSTSDSNDECANINIKSDFTTRSSQNKTNNNHSNAHNNNNNNGFFDSPNHLHPHHHLNYSSSFSYVNSNNDTCSDFDEDVDVSYPEMFKEIEEDDSLSDMVFSNYTSHSTPFGALNWFQEANAQLRVEEKNFAKDQVSDSQTNNSSASTSLKNPAIVDQALTNLSND